MFENVNWKKVAVQGLKYATVSAVSFAIGRRFERRNGTATRTIETTKVSHLPTSQTNAFDRSTPPAFESISTKKTSAFNG